MIDFGDCFGIIHAWDELVKRFGHSGYLDGEHIVTDFVTLGLVDRPWHHARYGAAGVTLGYYDDHRFSADGWRPGYANNAYDRMTEADAAWMARIVARFREEHIRALVARGRFSEPIVSSELERILIGRRKKILERWLTKLSPLTWPEVRSGEGGEEVCLEDVAVSSGIREADTRRYETRAFRGDALSEIEVAAARVEDGTRVCVPLPRVPGASAEQPEYVIVDVAASTRGRETTGPVRLHFYALGEDAHRLVGLERPDGRGAPTP
jgi:hypothetical protein